MRKRRVLLENPPRFLTPATAVGKGESEGPLGDLFDFHDETDRFGQPTWELAEGEMSRIALALALRKNRVPPENVSVLFAGDLQNQCVASSVGLHTFGIPYVGLYGACSTCAEGLMLAGIHLSAHPEALAAVVTSSHNCAAERQFRTPIEYGGQRSPTAQWTATAAGAFLLSGVENVNFQDRSGNAANPEKTPDPSDFSSVCIRSVLPGKIVNAGVSDASNMGAAMAPAAADSVLAFLRECGSDGSDPDAVVTGDLGAVGSALFLDLMRDNGFDLSKIHVDCGLKLFDPKRQDVHSGASGCGCSAAVLAALLLPKLASRSLKRALFLSTGALMSPSSIKQGQSIGGVAHLVELVRL